MKTLAELEAEIFEIEANGALPKLPEPSFGSFDSIDLGRCYEIERILKRLSTTAGPQAIRPEIWTQVVNDACWLLESGKAAEAIGAGWSVMELFGWSSSSWQSVAGWLGGSRPIMIGQAIDGDLRTKWACVRNGSRRRWLIRNFDAGSPDDGTLLWHLKHSNNGA